MRKALFLTKFSMLRPVTVAMVFIALLVVGGIAYVRIPIEMIATGNDSRTLHLRIPYGNSTPVLIEQQITRPVEGILRTLAGIEHIYSSSGDWGAYLRVTFRQGVDLDEAYNQLRDRCDRAMAILPDDVRDIRIYHWTSDDMPILGIDLVADGEVPDLHELVVEQIKRPLERLDGVADVGVYGTQASRVQIELSRDRMNLHRVDTNRLFRQMQGDNFAMSGGWVRDGTRKLYVRSDCRYSSINEIRDLPIDGHSGLRLSDIANVAYEKPSRSWYYRINGNDAAFLSIRKKSSANTVEATEQALIMLHNEILSRPQLKGFEPYVYWSQANLILTSLSQLRSSGLWGGFFAILVLYFFLRRTRTTLLISGAIPLSILVSLGVVYFSGWSLNIHTMMGLIIAFGMVVDNSIVVVEAIYARRINGENSWSASLFGASEVGLAITVSTLTTLVVFLPLIFMSGNDDLAFELARIGMPVIYALLASLLVALVFIPVVARRTMSESPPEEPRGIVWLNATYRKGLDWVLLHRLEAFVVTLAVFATISYPAGNIKRPNWEDRSSSMHVSFDLPDHYNIAQSDTIMTAYETYMLEHRAEYGLEEVEVGFSRGRGYIWSPFTRDNRPWYMVTWNNITHMIGIDGDGPMPRKEVYEDMRENMPKFAGVRRSIDRKQDDTQRTSVTLFGDDTETLVRLASEVERRLRLVPGVTDVDSDHEDGKDEILLRVNRNRAQQAGVSTYDIGRTIGGVMRGTMLPDYHTDEREIDIRLELDIEDRYRLDQVMNLTVTTENGNRVPVSSLVSVTHSRGMRRISRENGRTRVRVTAISTDKDIGNLSQKISNALDGLELPRGYQWNLSGRFQQVSEEKSDMQFAVILAVAFVFLLMGILFESFILPLSIVMSIPFSFLGVYWLLWLTDTAMGPMVFVGMIVLVGVVVNNAIVLVDLVNQLRASGYDRNAAIMEAGRQRFRPILMTSLTTIVGLVPMALGSPVMLGSFYVSLGTTLIGGLTTSTVLTLFVVPLFYTLFDDLRERSRSLFGVMIREPSLRSGSFGRS
jgi:hydrophobic/amphiphilic exporter-1 (mainly G- bacteria), HAE1 family